MYFKGIGICIAAGGVLSGCAIKPVPGSYGFTDPTVTIYRHIRCEIKEALRSRVIDLLLGRSTSSDVIPNEESRLLGEYFQSSPEAREHVDLLDVSGKFNKQLTIGKKIPQHILDLKVQEEIVQQVGKFVDTTIAYRYTFTITEANNRGGSLGFSLPFLGGGGSFSLGVGASNNTSRANRRVIEASDLFRTFSLVNCRKSDVDQFPNFLYPSSGKIGMAEALDSYITFKGSIGDLSGSKFTSFSDQLTFTTVLSLNADPQLTFVPSGPGNFRLGSANFDLDNSRTDTHELLFTITEAELPKSERVESRDLGNGIKISFPRQKSATKNSSITKTKPGNQKKISNAGKRSKQTQSAAPDPEQNSQFKIIRNKSENEVGSLFRSRDREADLRNLRRGEEALRRELTISIQEDIVDAVQ